MSVRTPDLPKSSPAGGRALTELTPAEKRALLKEMLARSTPPEKQPFGMLSEEDREKLPAGLEDAYPMIRMQAGMLFHSEFSSESAIFHDLHSLRLRLPLDRERLRRTLAELLDRHQILRTSFDLVRFSKPMQLVHQEIEVPLEIVELGAGEQSLEEQEGEIERWLDAERQRAFDWSQPPLLHFRIHVLSDGSFQFTLSFHHAILDGWSAATFLTELFRRYEAHLRGSAEPLASLQASLRDFVALEQEALASQECREYWRQQLKGWSFAELPRWRPAGEDARGRAVDVVNVPLPASVGEGLERLAKRAGTPLKNVLLAAHLRVISLVASKTDVVTGLLSHGRQATAGGEDVLGVFLNILPFRQRLSGGTWLDLVRETFRIELEMRPYRRFPLAELQKVEGDQPLFEATFNFMHYHIYQRTAADDSSSAEVLDWTSYEETNFPLLANFAQTPGTGCLELMLNYLTAELSPAVAKAIGGLYGRALRALAESPDSRYERDSLLSAAQRQQLACEWNAVDRDYPRSRSVIELFAQQVQLRPDAVALEWREEILTYRELDERSNRLAHCLLAHGVHPEDKVALSLRRTPRLVIAILGSLKAGTAYLPVDATYPRERQEYMLSDSAAPVLVSESAVPTMDFAIKVRRIDFDADAATIAAQPATPPSVVCAPHQLAYVIYTSGSTGAPKGVAVQHRGIVRLVQETNFADFGPEEVWLQLTAVSFDVSTLEFWGALLHGGRLVLPGHDKPSPSELTEMLVQSRVTSLWLTAGHFHQVVENAVEGLGGLRQLLAGGDVLSVPHVKKVIETHPDLVMIDGYGPTENTTFTSCHSMRSLADVGASVSIGRPIANSTVHLLDAFLEPVLHGAIGALWTGGDGVARAYSNQPIATAKVFVPDPFCGRPGERLYNTGDLARFAATGLIEFLGRADHQVKVRGFRIELGEIETALGDHPAVGDVVVVAREDQPGQKRLAAYWVATSSQEAPTPAELRRFLGGRLPDHMVPSFFVALDELPLNPSGKVDRKALPVPEVERADIEASFVAPRNATEEALAEVWGSVLGIARVGVKDNFFDLGGDSILSLQISAQAQQRGIRLTSRQIFEHPNIAGLADVLGSSAEIQAEQGLVMGAVPLTPIQHWFFEHDLSRPWHWNQAVFLTPRQVLDASVLDAALESLILHHDALRLRFQSDRDRWKQQHADSVIETPQTHVDLGAVEVEVAAGQIERLAAQAQASLDLSRGPLLRVIFMQTSTAAVSRLLWVAHHLVIDGVSWQILLADFHVAYEQHRRAQPLSLPLKTTSFRQWGERLTEYAQSPQLHRELAYWQGLAWGRVRPLPVDFPSADRKQPEATVESVTTVLEADLTDALLQEVPGAFGVRINAILLAALGEALAIWLDRRPLVLDLEGHGREEIFEDVDVTRTVGWFTSVFPVVVDPGEKFDAVKAVWKVQENLEKMPNHGVGFGVLRYLTPDVDVLRDLPRAEVSFNYLGQMDRVLAESELLEGAGDRLGLLHDPEGKRHYVIEINSLVSEGCLRVTWGFSPQLHRRSTIEGLANRYIRVLRDFIAEAKRATPRSPAAFPLAKLDAEALEGILERRPDADIEDIYPLTPLQKGMLFHSLYEPQSGLYVQHLACLLRGELDREAFSAAWQRVATRHSTLRTSFAWEGLEEPLQVVGHSIEIPIIQLDWTGLSRAEQQQRIDELIIGARQEGFPLAEAPLMRIVLARLDAGRHRMIWIHHHLLLDGWSRSTLIGELLFYYQALQQGVDQELTRPRALRDYIAWLQAQDLEKARAFWHNSLADLPEPVTLGRDQGVSHTGVADHTDLVLTLSAEATEALMDLVRRTRLTLNVVVQGAWALLLNRYSGQEDVVYGAIVSGRPASLDGAETMIGMMINTLPMRTRLDPSQTLLDWLRGFQSWQIESREYEYTPLVQVQSWAGVPREQALFESIFVFENFPFQQAGDSTSPSLEGDDFQVGGAVNYPLCATVVPDEQLAVTLRYHRSRFDPEMIQQMASDLEAILEAMPRQPDEPLAVLMRGFQPDSVTVTNAFNDDLEDF